MTEKQLKDELNPTVFEIHGFIRCVIILGICQMTSYKYNENRLVKAISQE